MSDAVSSARALCPPELVREWTRRTPARTVLATAVLWAQLVGAWWVALAGPPLAWIPCFVVICACVSAMQLWVHESSHYTLFADRRHNDAWADAFFASPIGMSVKTYRRFHMTHHAHLGTPRDMDRFAFNVDVRGRRRLAVALLRGLLCIEGARIVAAKYLGAKRAAGPGTRAAKVLSVLWNGLLLAACVLCGRWYLYLLLWAYPIVGVAVTLNVVRSVGEHQSASFARVADDDEDLPRVVRSTMPNPLEKWLMFQANFNYHFEHHLFPGIPSTTLPRVREHLGRGGFYARHPEVVQPSAVRTFLQLSLGRGRPA